MSTAKSISQQITRVLGTDDWLILHSGHHMVTAEELDDIERADTSPERTALRKIQSEAWLQGHAAGRDYQGDGWNQDAHDPNDDNPYRPNPAQSKEQDV